MVHGEEQGDDVKCDPVTCAQGFAEGCVCVWPFCQKKKFVDKEHDVQGDEYACEFAEQEHEISAIKISAVAQPPGFAYGARIGFGRFGVEHHFLFPQGMTSDLTRLVVVATLVC